MNYPYSGYSELAPVFPYYADSPALSDPDVSGPQLMHDESTPHLLRPYPALRSYSTEQSHIPCPFPNEQYMFEDFNGMPSVMWDSSAEPETYFNGTLVHTFPPSDYGFPPETYTPGHHVSYTPDHSYTRMFRGRKSKSASEVGHHLHCYLYPPLTFVM